MSAGRSSRRSIALGTGAAIVALVLAREARAAEHAAWRADVPCGRFLETPRATARPGCAAAACVPAPGGDEVCTCKDADDGALRLVVARHGAEGAAWPIEPMLGETTAFRVTLADLDGDARDELIVSVLDALERAHRRYKLAALSNGNADLKRIGAGRLFDVVLSAETVGRAKPHPAMFERALADANVAADEAVHVGDHPEHDVLAARGAGLHAVWANPLALPRPDALPRDVPALHRFDELDDVLERLTARKC